MTVLVWVCYLYTTAHYSYVWELICVILELGFQEVDIIVNEALDSHQVITMAGMTWTKQARGSAVTRLCDVDEVRAFLLTYTQNFAYDPRNHNCHSAQEELRRWLGQSVPEDRPFTTFTRTLASWVPASIAKSRLPD
jgi:hypothetical protein